MIGGDKSIHGVWNSRLIFILAATGSAVGLGNIWKFPYITGENGGGAFVLVYLLCILFVGIPIMMAEVMLGRRGRQSPINTMKALSQTSGIGSGGQIIGWMGALSGFLILTFYSVIAGWAINYVFKLGGGDFIGADAATSEQIFGGLLGSPIELTIYHSIFIATTLFIVAKGVNEGLEKATKILMPGLFVLLMVLFGYSLSLDTFGQGFDFLFTFDFSKISGESFVIALGHSFFTLSLGLGAMMAYGAYMPGKTSIASTVITVAALDTIVALVSGLIIFPIVFANGLEPGAGPGLMFQTLPLAFGQMPGGTLFGSLFFILVSFAAWSSAISLLEPTVSWATESTKYSRPQITLALGALAWLIGIGSVLSFNEWSEIKLFGRTFFDNLDFLTANIMLPLGGLLIAIFVGWFFSEKDSRDELEMEGSSIFPIWLWTIKIVSPLAVAYVALKGLSVF
jgi:NSS family neurotransmitter:Na+ symporter